MNNYDVPVKWQVFFIISGSVFAVSLVVNFVMAIELIVNVH